MQFPVPNSFGSLQEFNHCHAADSGRFCSTPGGARGARKGGAEGSFKRETPIKVSDIDEAVSLILKGKVVELPDVKRVNTVLTKLAKMATDAEARGEKAPDYDLCKVSVPGTNLFCRTGLKTKEYPNGVPRIEMPQFSGKPVPGSRADKLKKNANGNIDGAQSFIRHLTINGVRVTEGTVPAARLKSSQAQLVGAQVASMMVSKTYNPGQEPIFVSRDGYVIDGHHRWAAVVGRDGQDGRLGQSRMRVVRVDMPISEVLKLGKAWAKQFGIAGKKG